MIVNAYRQDHSFEIASMNDLKCDLQWRRRRKPSYSGLGAQKRNIRSYHYENHVYRPFQCKRNH